MSGYAGIILAGGDGTRLSSLTRELAGDERPKQFCRLIGEDTLLEQTRRRARLLVARERLLTVVTRHHERFYRPALADALPRSVVVQPENRGTAPAVVYSLLRHARPELLDAFAPIRGRLGTPGEEDAARDVYARLPPVDLSRDVFQASSGRLAVLPVSGVGWNDLGDPARVHATRAQVGRELASA